MEYSERYNQPERQDEQLCERCQSLLGGQAAKVSIEIETTHSHTF